MNLGRFKYRKTTRNCQNFIGITLLLSWVAMSLTGCSTLGIHGGLFKSSELDDNMPTASALSYKVIFESRSGKPQIYRGTIAGNTTVQQALEESGAMRKRRDLQVDLARVVPETGKVLRLPITFDPKKKKVLEEQNYSIHDGDEILVRKKSSGAIDAVLSAVVGDG